MEAECVGGPLETARASNSMFQDDPQPHYSQYAHLFKTSGMIFSQNDRRRAILKAVKERRNASIDEKRGISEILEVIERPMIEEEMMEVAVPCKKKKKKFASKLMLSEYLKEMPSDLEHNWIFKLCPTGYRNLVVANNRTTKAYNKMGTLQTEFESLLPGGGPNNRASKFTILDCIFNPPTETYYVLDILAWNSYSLHNCSAEFRFFFLKAKIDENHEISTKSRHNKYPFYEGPARPAQVSILETLLSRPIDMSNKVSLDGILFYHAEVDYRSGVTPLVGWLKPYMVPEILHIPVHSDYMAEKPENYSTLENHIGSYQKNRKYKQRKVKDVEMVEDFVDDLEVD